MGRLLGAYPHLAQGHLPWSLVRQDEFDGVLNTIVNILRQQENLYHAHGDKKLKKILSIDRI